MAISTQGDDRNGPATGTLQAINHLIARRRRFTLYVVLGLLFGVWMGLRVAEDASARSFADGFQHIPDFFTDFFSYFHRAELERQGLSPYANMFSVETEDRGSIARWLRNWPEYVDLLWQTVNAALFATLLGFCLAVVLAFVASHRYGPTGILALWVTRLLALLRRLGMLDDTRHRSAQAWAEARLPRTLLRDGVRRLLELCRSVPELISALFLVYLLGGGALAAVFALTIHTVGALGKLFSEVADNAPPGPVEGLASSGANWVQRMRYGTLPQVLPNFYSYGLLRLEINIRVSAILGYVGAGGIGQELQVRIAQGNEPQAFAIIVLLIATIILIDWISAVLRQRLIRDQEGRPARPGWLRIVSQAVRWVGAQLTEIGADLWYAMQQARPALSAAVGRFVHRAALGPPDALDPAPYRAARQRLWIGLGVTSLVMIYVCQSLLTFQILRVVPGLSLGALGTLPALDWGEPFQRGSEFFWRAWEAMVGWGTLDPQGQKGWINFWFWPHGAIWEGVLQTLVIAFLGTLFATLTAIPLAFMAARNVQGQFWYGLGAASLLLLAVLGFPALLTLVLAAASLTAIRFHVMGSGAEDKAVRWLMTRAGHSPRFESFARRSTRFAFGVVRGVDTLIWALVFIRAFGLGPIAGILAIWLVDSGTLGKLFSEAIENIDRKQPEGVRATGARQASVYRFGYLPQVFPVMLSQALYFFESNVRSATIIGAVGAGGIGLLITERIRADIWDQTLYIVLIILVLVYVIDQVSYWVRMLVIRQEERVKPPGALVALLLSLIHI